MPVPKLVVTVAALMNISSDGSITLTRAVSMNTTSMKTVVSVYAPGYPNVSTTVTVSLRVNGK